jgi:GT2 family glycosyltransferase
MDLCLKVGEAGFRNICLSKLHAIHHEGVSRKKNKHKSQKTRERQERKTFYHRHAKRLSRFDTTLSRGFDMREDFGQTSRFLWKSPLSKRLFTGRLPYTRWRFSLFQSADYALHTLWDKIPKHTDAKEPPS